MFTFSRPIIKHSYLYFRLSLYSLQQSLQYLRKVCNHPSLVLKASHPEYASITAQMKGEKSSLDDIQHSGKLMALK